MVVILDTVLSENALFMAELAGELQALGVMYRVSHGLFPGSVRWKRSVSERSVTDEAQVGVGGREEGGWGKVWHKKLAFKYWMLSFFHQFSNTVITKYLFIVIIFFCLFCFEVITKCVIVFCEGD